MTDDQTQRYDTKPAEPPAPTPAADTPGVEGAAPATSAATSAAPSAATTEAATPASTAPVAAATAAGASKARWLVAFGVAGVAIVAAVAAMLVFSKPSTPEALGYIPGDAAFVMEVRMDLPGDQMQNVGNLLAHFPGFQDQSTLSQKIDLALSRLIASAPGSSIDYQTEVKPLISGPMFIGVRSFEDMTGSGDPKNMVVVATTTGTVTCGTVFRDEAPTVETYNGVQLSIGSRGTSACAIDGRFFLVGDPAGVKAAIDARKQGSGLDKSARYQAARTALGLDRLATMYVDGASLAKAMPAASADLPIGDLSSAIPEWVMAGLRAENDAVLMDVVVAAAPSSTAGPSLRTSPPVHPLTVTAFAPPDSLVFVEAQGAGVAVLNTIDQLKSNPELGEALKGLDAFGGIDGLVNWVDDLGVVVVRQGDEPAGGVILVAKDAASASEKVTALETVLALGALGGDIEVTTSTVEGVKVTSLNIPDAGALAGAAIGGNAAVPLDLSIAAKDRFVIVGVGKDVMSKLLGVKAGSTLAEDAAFKRALARGLANPQVVVYVAAGATIDWAETAAAALGGTTLPPDAKAYLDPLEGFIYTMAGDGSQGRIRIGLTVTTP